MFKQYIDHFSEAVSLAEASKENFVSCEITSAYNQATELIKSCKKVGGTVYLVGNGGSSGIVSHSSVDFVNACKIKAVPLTDNSQITCFANDYGYEQVFSKPLETLISEKDVLIAVSSSGSSLNIVNAVQVALQKNAGVITFSGFLADNPLRKLGHYNFWLNSNDYGVVEIGHALLLHLLTDMLKVDV